MSPRLRRFVAGCSLASFSLLLIGVPISQPIHKDAARPFPCQHHACGCFDAEACWESCCCFTHEEKLAWAQEHGLAPFAVTAMSAAEHTTASRPEHDDCCAGERTCAVEAADADARESSTSCCDELPPRDGDSPPPYRLVWGARLMHCQGGAPVWTVIGPAVAPPVPFTLALRSEIVERIAVRDDSRGTINPPVASPPPELG